MHTVAPTYTLIVLAFASFFAGAMNSMAGGGSFITLPALIFTGIDARAANITAGDTIDVELTIRPPRRARGPSPL